MIISRDFSTFFVIMILGEYMKRLKKIIDISKIETLSILVIISVLTIVSIGSILVTYHSLELKQLSYFLIFFLPIEVILYLLTKIHSFKFNKKEIIVFILFILSTLSLIGSNSISTSIWGFYNRYEGLLVIYSYYSIALLASTVKSDYYKKIIIGFILIIGFVNIIYGLFQTGLIPLDIGVKDSWKYARGFQGNSMYFASIISICYFFVVGLLLVSEKKFDWKILVLLLVFTLGNVISGSMALFCTTIFIFLLLVIKELLGIKLKYFSKERFIKLIVCIVIFVIINIIFLNNDQNYKRDVKTLSHEVSNISETKKADNSYGTGRVYIWKKVIEKSKDNLLFGVGVDNVYNSFSPKLIDPVSGYSIDKAHNDYLQRLLCEGLFSFLCYILLLTIIVLENFKSKDKIRVILFLGFFAYITQIFFSISVIRVAPIYWIVLGLLMSDVKKKNNKKVQV